MNSLEVSFFFFFFYFRQGKLFINCPLCRLFPIFGRIPSVCLGFWVNIRRLYFFKKVGSERGLRVFKGAHTHFWMHLICYLFFHFHKDALRRVLIVWPFTEHVGGQLSPAHSHPFVDIPSSPQLVAVSFGQSATYLTILLCCLDVINIWFLNLSLSHTDKPFPDKQIIGGTFNIKNK